MTHRKVAEDCWRLIRALVDPEDINFDATAIHLIELACDSAAESQRACEFDAPLCPDCGKQHWPFYGCFPGRPSTEPEGR